MAEWPQSGLWVGSLPRRRPHFPWLCLDQLCPRRPSQAGASDRLVGVRRTLYCRERTMVKTPSAMKKPVIKAVRLTTRAKQERRLLFVIKAASLLNVQQKFRIVRQLALKLHRLEVRVELQDLVLAAASDIKAA